MLEMPFLFQNVVKYLCNKNQFLLKLEFLFCLGWGFRASLHLTSYPEGHGFAAGFLPGGWGFCTSQKDPWGLPGGS